MIRFVFRLIGLMSLAAGFILAIYDGMRSMASNTLSLTSVSEFWDMLQSTGTQNFQRLVESYSPVLWDTLVVPVLSAPSWAVLGVFGILLMLLGRKKRPLIGYAR
jgi:disulfide bond formation protein DsbB